MPVTTPDIMVNNFHVETKPDGVSWNQAKKKGLINKSTPEGYTPGSGTGFLPDERAWLNRYHATVRERLAPRVEGAALAWLQERTEPV